jgi:4-amino-4-deoxy-L-arabinose transferase-like glycosyltransferase
MKKNNLILITIIFLAAILRLAFLDQYPAGLNADEAAIGYNTYSLLKTGHDEHGASWPLVFQSFNDYKPAGYFYMVLPFIKLLGLNIWSVRLPSALLGVATVYLVYLLVEKIFKNKNLSLLSAFMLAISPWHLHFSRGGWEVNAALFFMTLAIYLFIRSLENSKFFIYTALSSIIALYTYHSIRLIFPFILLSLTIIYFDKLKPFFVSKNKNLIIAFILGFILILPLAKQMISSQGQSRFQGVSIFADEGPLWQALELRREYQGPQIIGRILYNKYFFYSNRFIQNYLSHFTPHFLFINGDEIARSKVPDMGQSYIFLAPFLLIGLFSVLKLDTKAKKIILVWFLLSPLAAAMTFQSPHALRSQNMIIPLTVITSLGTFQFFNWLKYPKLKFVTFFLLFIILSASFAIYLHRYYVAYPRQLPTAWEYGFDQLADYIEQNQDKYDQIIISDRYDQPYIIMAFYLKYPPEKFQKEIVLEPRDKFGFSTVRHFGKLNFRSINWDEDKNLTNTLIISTTEPISDEKVATIITSLAGETLFKIIPND